MIAIIFQVQVNTALKPCWEGVKLFSSSACNAMWSPPSMASGPCCVWIEFQIPLVPVVKPY